MFVVVPIPHPVGLARRAPDMPLFTSEPLPPGLPNKQDPGSHSQRVTEPILPAVPRITFKVRRNQLIWYLVFADALATSFTSIICPLGLLFFEVFSPV